MISRRHILQAGAALAVPILSPLARAQRVDSAKVLVGFAPGGANDIVSRAIAAKMGSYAKSVVVENRTGAGGQLACAALKTAPADGSVLLCSPFSCTAIYPHVYKKLPYDALTDFATVSTAASFTLGLAAGPGVPSTVRSVPDYLQWIREDVKARGGYGHPAAGSASHFVGALLGLDAKIDMVPVPYRGSTPGIVDAMAGQVPVMLTGTGDLLPFVKSGKLRVLATSGPARDVFLPEVPTFKEQGFPNIVAEETVGFYAPAKTPRDIIDAANRAIAEALQSPDVISQLAGIGLAVRASTPESMSATLKSEHRRWAVLVKRIGFTAES